jgi:hypothetical protein
MKEAVDWMAQYQRFWEGQLNSLARYLEDTASDQDGPRERPTDEEKLEGNNR